MGLIKAAMGAGGGILADQWKEFFRCDSIPEDVLVVKGQKSVGARSSNTKGTDNIITTGSIIKVGVGQSMIITDQGRIAEFCSEEGEYEYKASTEPSIFCGNLGDGILKSFAEFGKRFTFGGEVPKDQRVYYFNTKELIGNKYGTPSPVPFRVVDQNIGLDVDISIRCFGEYSYRIVDPILFFKNVCGEVTEDYNRSRIESQLKTELLTALGPAFAKISAMGIRYSALPGHSYEIAQALNEVLSDQWRNKRGLEVVTFGVSSVKAPEEDEAMIKELQRTAVFRNPGMAGAYMVGAQGEAMKAAASNPNGAMMGFMGMGMAQQAGGMNANQLFQMAQQPQYQQPQQPQYQQPQQPQYQQPQQPQYQQPAAPAPAADGWKCACGATVSGKFCPECGAKKPEPKPANGWTCACGATATGNFCPECGAKKPAGVPQYKCDKCGWQPADPTKAPRFCPECGDPFDAGDIV